MVNIGLEWLLEFLSPNFPLRPVPHEVGCLPAGGGAPQLGLPELDDLVLAHLLRGSHEHGPGPGGRGLQGRGLQGQLPRPRRAGGHRGRGHCGGRTGRRGTWATSVILDKMYKLYHFITERVRSPWQGRSHGWGRGAAGGAAVGGHGGGVVVSWQPDSSNTGGFLSST